MKKLLWTAILAFAITSSAQAMVFTYLEHSGIYRDYATGLVPFPDEPCRYGEPKIDVASMTTSQIKQTLEQYKLIERDISRALLTHEHHRPITDQLNSIRWKIYLLKKAEKGQVTVGQLAPIFEIINQFFRGETESARKKWTQLAGKTSPFIQPWGRYFLGAIEYRRGKFLAGYRQFTRLNGDRDLKIWAQWMKSCSLFQLLRSLHRDRWEKEFLGTMNNLVKNHPNHYLADDALGLMGRYYFYKNKLSVAAVYYDKILRQYPHSDQFIHSFISLYKTIYPMLSRWGKSRLPRDTRAMICLQRHYLGHSLPQGTVAAVARIKSPFRPYARYLLGRYYMGLGKWKQAVSIFQEVIGRAPTSHFAAYSLFGMGCAYRYLYEQATSRQMTWFYNYSAMERLRELVENFPHHSLADEALVELACLWRERDKLGELPPLVEKVWQAYPRRNREVKILKILREIELEYNSAHYLAPLKYPQLRQKYLNRYDLFRPLFDDYPCSQPAKKAVAKVLQLLEKRYNVYHNQYRPRPLAQEEKKVLVSMTKALVKMYHQAPSTQYRTYFAGQLARTALLLHREEECGRWLKQAQKDLPRHLTSMVQWINVTYLTRRGDWEEAYRQCLQLSSREEGVFSNLGRLRSLLVAERLGKYDYCLRETLARGHTWDLRYLLDIRLPTSVLKKYLENHRSSSKSKIVAFSLGVRYFRSNRPILARKVLTRLLRQKPGAKYTRYVKNILNHLGKWQVLYELSQKGKTPEERADALYKLATLCFKEGLIFYNAPLWNYQRISLIYERFCRLPAGEKKDMVREYMWHHNALERSIALYRQVAEKYPQSKEAPKALYMATRSYMRLYRYNSYYRYEEWILKGARKVAGELAEKYPKSSLGDDALFMVAVEMHGPQKKKLFQYIAGKYPKGDMVRKIARHSCGR